MDDDWTDYVGHIAIAVGVMVLLILIIAGMMYGGEVYTWSASDCEAVGAHNGLPLWECVGMPD